MSSATFDPYQSFAKIFTSYHDRYATAGSSSSRLDASIRHDAILDEDGGLIVSLMSALEEMYVWCQDPFTDSRWSEGMV